MADALMSLGVTGPRGEVGPKGDPGPQGPSGNSGIQNATILINNPGTISSVYFVLLYNELDYRRFALMKRGQWAEPGANEWIVRSGTAATSTKYIILSSGGICTTVGYISMSAIAFS